MGIAHKNNYNQDCCIPEKELVIVVPKVKSGLGSQWCFAKVSKISLQENLSRKQVLWQGLYLSQKKAHLK